MRIAGEGSSSLEDNVQKLSNLGQDSIFFGITRSRFELSYIDDTNDIINAIKTHLDAAEELPYFKYIVRTSYENLSILELSKICLIRSLIISLYYDLSE